MTTTARPRTRLGRILPVGKDDVARATPARLTAPVCPVASLDDPVYPKYGELVYPTDDYATEAVVDPTDAVVAGARDGDLFRDIDVPCLLLQMYRSKARWIFWIADENTGAVWAKVVGAFPAVWSGGAAAHAIRLQAEIESGRLPVLSTQALGRRRYCNRCDRIFHTSEMERVRPIGHARYFLLCRTCAQATRLQRLELAGSRKRHPFKD